MFFWYKDLCGFWRDLVWNVCLVFCLSQPLNDCRLRTVLCLGRGAAASHGGPFSLLAIGLGITCNPISFYFIGGETCWGCFWKLSRTAEGLRFYWTYKVEVSLSHVSNTLPENTRSPNSEAKTFMTDCSGSFKFLSLLLAPWIRWGDMEVGSGECFTLWLWVTAEKGRSQEIPKLIQGPLPTWHHLCPMLLLPLL